MVKPSIILGRGRHFSQFSTKFQCFFLNFKKPWYFFNFSKMSKSMTTPIGMDKNSFAFQLIKS